jgi:hypothetical protein
VVIDRDVANMVGLGGRLRSQAGMHEAKVHLDCVSDDVWHIGARATGRCQRRPIHLVCVRVGRRIPQWRRRRRE